MDIYPRCDASNLLTSFDIPDPPLASAAPFLLLMATSMGSRSVPDLSQVAPLNAKGVTVTLLVSKSALCYRHTEGRLPAFFML